MRNVPQRRIAVVGGGLAGLEFAVRAAEGGAAVEVFEAGPQTRIRHMYWDTATHAGDKKMRFWTSENWGIGGGLSERLGGRSLCYHGVLLRLEGTALKAWGPVWAKRFKGDGGLYESVLNGLRDDFPELEAGDWRPAGALSALRHVPQAARLDRQGRFEAYSPLARALELSAEGRIRLTRERVHAVRSELQGCAIEIMRGVETEQRRGFDTCVLAASAIGNVHVLAASLRRHITTAITDHFCVGAFVRLPPGLPLRPFRHRMLESAFVPAPQIFANVFFLERPAFPNGDRLVQIQGIIEQQGGPEAFSELTVALSPGGVHSHIRANISDADRLHLDAVRAEILRWARRLAGGPLDEIGPDHATTSSTQLNQDRSKSAWFGHDEAYNAVAARGAFGVLSQYDVPYGAFDHEACTHPLDSGGPVPVSAELEVKELPGVYVLGPGAFPRLGVANPALTLLALSRWLGDRLAAS